jgi:hypothetical protein
MEGLGFASSIDPAVLARLSGGDVAAGLRGLAEALVASPAWSGMDDAVVAVRSEPRPVLGVLGDIPPAAVARMELLSWQLDQVAGGLRYVDYEGAQGACLHLADRLVKRLGADVLADCAFQAIPRGGLIVLGMLAYALELRPEQLAAPPPAGAPVVVVDDCALSGARFRDHLEQLDTAHDVVFAHLYSTPQLRVAIEAAEPRVLACVAADDLRDVAPDIHGDGYPAWRERWAERHPRDYWIGHPEPVCFAWNEPDVDMWNPVTLRTEPGWRLVPPERCMKNRPGRDASPQVIQVHGSYQGSLRPADAVIFGDVRDGLIVVNAEDTTGVRLTGVAADMWRTLVASGSREAAIDTLANRYEVSPERLAGDFDDVVDRFVAAGLLERRP